MRPSVLDQQSGAHPVLADVPTRMAKARIRKTDVAELRAHVGAAIQRAASLAGWSLKELAGAVNRDPRQVARWLAGTERPQLDALFAVEALRQPLVVALAELAGDGVEIETVVRVRRQRGAR